MLGELVKALSRNGQRYNLLNSAILECFKYIKDENVKSLVNNVIDNYWTTNGAVKNIKYSNLFTQIKEKYDQNMAEQVSLGSR